jgi:hypothetical protein
LSKHRQKAAAASPRIRTRTEEQYAADERARAAHRRAAGRQAFRFVMLLSHGCTGRSCASDRHPADLAGLRDVLMALGVIPDPQAQWAVGLHPDRVEGPRRYKSSLRRKAISG